MGGGDFQRGILRGGEPNGWDRKIFCVHLRNDTLTVFGKEQLFVLKLLSLRTLMMMAVLVLPSKTTRSVKANGS